MSPPPVTVASVLSAGILACPFIFPYFLSSVALTFYNRWALSKVPFPLSVTVVHLLATFGIVYLVRKWSFPVCREDKPIVLSWRAYLCRVALPAMAGGLDIGLSNWSLVFITVSMYALSKSTAVVFILLFALLFGLEKPRTSLFIVIALIFSGLFMFSYHSQDFNGVGFALVMMASFLGGLRWTSSQILMQRGEDGLSNPVDTVFHLIPIMLFVLTPLALFIEGKYVVSSYVLLRAPTWSVLFRSLGVIGFGAVLACMLNVFEFLLLVKTSSLTLSIVGIVKEISMFPIAHKLNGDHFSTLNIFGCIICVIGIIVHVVLKASTRESDAAHFGSVRNKQDKWSTVSSFSLNRGHRRNKTHESMSMMAADALDDSDEDEVVFATSHI